MDVFISYPRADAAEIEELETILELHELTHFVDQAIRNGESFTERLVHEIEDCSAFVWFATENTPQSKWCLMEAAIAFSREKAFFVYSPPAKGYQFDPGKHLPPFLVSRNHPALGIKDLVAKIQQACIERRTRPNRFVKDIGVAELESLVRRAMGLTPKSIRDEALEPALLVLRGLFNMIRPGSDILDDAGQMRASHQAVKLGSSMLSRLLRYPRDPLHDLARQFLGPAQLHRGEDGREWELHAVHGEESCYLALAYDNERITNAVAVALKSTNGGVRLDPGTILQDQADLDNLGMHRPLTPIGEPT